jgi:hypothetical protein
MLHAQNRHAMQPHCCYRIPGAIGETGPPELKLVPFVGRPDACKLLARWSYMMFATLKSDRMRLVQAASTPRGVAHLVVPDQ